MANQIAERRDFARYDTDVPATVTSPTMRISVKMLSVSAGGALVRMDRLSSKVFDDATFVLDIGGVGRFAVSRKWRRDTDMGCKFEMSDTDRQYLAERLQDRFGAPKLHGQRLSSVSPRP